MRERLTICFGFAFLLMLATSAGADDALVKGTVTDAKGKPVALVKATLAHVGMTFQPDGEVVETVATDASGHYAFTKPLKFLSLHGTDYSDHYLITVSDDSHAPGWSVITGSDEPGDRDIILDEVAIQQVRVTKPDGDPLANAAVQIIAAGEAFDRRPAFRQTAEFSSVLALAIATTDASGEATMHLPRTRQSLLITCPGYADQVISLTGAPQKDVVTCRMIEAGTVTGIVNDPEGKPLADAWVCLANTQDRKPIYAKTDGEGRYTCDRLQPRAGAMTSIGRMRDYSIYLVDQRFSSATVETDVQEGQSESIDLNADRGTLVRVKVVEGEQNRAVGGAYIGGVLGGHMIQGFTNELGVVEFRAPVGEGLLELRGPPGGSCYAENVPPQRIAVAGELQELTFEIPKLEPLVNIHGKIVDTTGKPVPSIEVMIACRDALRYPISRTSFILGTISGPDGDFMVKGFPAGRHLSIYATTRNRHSAATAEWDVPEAGGDLASPIKLADTVSCDVDFSAAVGTDVRNQRVMVAPIVGGASFAYVRPATIDAEGHMKMGGVIPGATYRVQGDSSGPMIQNELKKDIVLVPN